MVSQKPCTVETAPKKYHKRARKRKEEGKTEEKNEEGREQLIEEMQKEKEHSDDVVYVVPAVLTFYAV